ncbi:MAG: ABC transporter substrate-binding protein, partial [Spirochaetales bacterium]|nr:ABC transporter substrate-binding protein [Spirochaetales bacterium]
PITVVLDWLPNTNHAGLYLALERGWFAEERLDVEVVQPSEVGSEALVAAGAGQFGISHQEALTFARTADSPLPVVAIATILQHNTSGYAAPRVRGFENPGAFAGARYGGWGTPYEDAMLSAVMGPLGGDADDVEVINVGTMDILVAFEREIDFTWIFYGWDGVRAEIQGVDLDYFPLAEFDERLDYYTPIFITSEEMIADDPETVRAFLRALSRGYEATIADPAVAGEVLRNYAPEIDVEHARRSLDYLASYFRASADRWGVMDRAVWENFTAFMDENGLLPRPLDVEAAFTNEFLPGE